MPELMTEEMAHALVLRRERDHREIGEAMRRWMDEQQQFQEPGQPGKIPWMEDK